MTSTNRFKAEAVRDQLRKRGFLPDNIVRYCYRPFDVRWLYWEPETKLLDEKTQSISRMCGDGNLWIEAARSRSQGFRIHHGYFVHHNWQIHIIERGCLIFFPLYLFGGWTVLCLRTLVVNRILVSELQVILPISVLRRKTFSITRWLFFMLRLTVRKTSEHCDRTGRGFRFRRRKLHCSPLQTSGGKSRRCWTRKRLFPV